MKKIIAICMAALLLMAAVPVSLVMAGTEGEISAAATKNEVKAGETFDLTVEMVSNPGLTGWQFQVIYDEAVLELTTQTKGDIAAFDSMSFGPKKSPANAMWYDFLNPDVLDAGKLFTLTFAVKDGAALGATTLAVKPVEGNIGNFEMQPVTFNDDTVVTVNIVECQHQYDNCEDTTCNDCGATRAPVAHEYDNCEDASCNLCGATRAAGVCVYDNCADTDCNVCGATRAAGTCVSDADAPCQDGVCTACGAAVPATEAHSYFYACDTMCQICFEETNPTAQHDVVHNPAVEASDCQTMGYQEHWLCNDCGYVWLDEDLTIQTNQMSVKLGYGEHEYDSCADAECNLCGEIRDAVGCVSDADAPCQDGVCTVCGAAVPATEEHAYNYDCDTTCQNCAEETRPNATHDVQHELAKDAADCQTPGNIEHWYCDDCGCVWTDEALTNQTNKMAVKVIGDHTYDNACDAECNVCQESREVADHVYDNDCDADCNECGATREVPHNYDSCEDTECNDCGAIREPVDHTYDNACDADCNACGATREVADHVYDNACDADCNECGATREAADHVYDNDEDTDCNVCGATREVTTTTTATTKPAGEGDAEEPGDTGENVAVILVTGLIALIAAAAVVLFSKKKA